jgi:hypothetical protein
VFYSRGSGGRLQPLPCVAGSLGCGLGPLYGFSWLWQAFPLCPGASIPVYECTCLFFPPLLVGVELERVWWLQFFFKHFYLTGTQQLI